MSEEDFTKYETSYRQYYGSNYNKALRNLKNTKKRMEKQFAQHYPNAHLDRFKFNVILSKTGDVTGTSVTFKVCDGQFLDIMTDDFKKIIFRRVTLVTGHLGHERDSATVCPSIVVVTL